MIKLAKILDKSHLKNSGTPMNILLLGCYTRFLCSLIKLNSQIAIRGYPPPLTKPIPSYRINKLTNK